MRQVLQNLRSGQTIVEDVPVPGLTRNGVLIQTRTSLISSGSERMLVEFSKSSLISKAKSQPEKVKQVLDKIKTDGFLPTLEVVFSKLDEPMPLGYCNSGVVVAVGENVKEFKAGDRVANNGGHAEIVCVSKNLCAKIPKGVSDDQAAFTVLSSIGLQGIRLAAPQIGEKYVVYGLGLIGLVCVQLLRANGCEVLGVDINPNRLKLANKFGAFTVNSVGGNDVVAAANAWTREKGIDGVLITASAKTDEIIHQSAEMCRKRGHIILVGVVGLNLRRSDFYEKELTFQVACSYGPGRYDNSYEQMGMDYPYGFVRWTEHRNFEAILEFLNTGRLVVDDLITHRFPISKAPAAYAKISDDRNSLGVILEYPVKVERSSKISIPRMSTTPRTSRVTVGVIGAGNFSKMILMPALRKCEARIAYVADLKGEAALHLARKFGAENAVTDYKLLLQDEKVNTIAIAVRHNMNAQLVCEALEAGKHVFVEKPLALNERELSDVLSAVANASDRFFMVGFNRRFSRHSQKIKELVARRVGPLCMNMTINAGNIQPEHWVHDPKVGGGRIIGEGGHFIDLMVFLTGSFITNVYASMVEGSVAIQEDKMSIVLSFKDGSVGTINYFANGLKSYPKETLEVFSDGRVLRLENFRRVIGYGFAGFKKFRTMRQDKGHNAEYAAFVDLVTKGGPDPLIPLEQLANVTRATFAAVESARTGKSIRLS